MEEGESPPRNFEVADMRCFQNLSAYTPPEKWTEEAVHTNVSEGSARRHDERVLAQIGR